MDFCAKEVERIDHPRRVSSEPLFGEIPIASADETLTPPEILAVPSSVIPSSSTPIPSSPGTS